MIVASPGGRPPQIAPDELPLQGLYRWENETPDRVYFIQPFGGGQTREYSWRQTADEVRRMAAYLQAQGWPRDARIGILGKNSAGWIMADLAIWMAGYISVPLYPMQTADNIRQIAGHSEIVACFVGKLDSLEMLGGLDDSIRRIALPLAAETVEKSCPRWDDIISATVPIAGSPLRDGKEVATIVYTSGTTGQAKGVMHSFDTLTAGMKTLLGRMGMSANDRGISYLPLAHIMERVGLELGSLQVGLPVYFAEALNTFTADLRRARPTLFISVPRLWLKFQQGVLAQLPAQKLERLLRLPLVSFFVRRKILRGLGLEHVRLAFSGSAPLPADVKAWFARLGLPIFEGYGMTEVANASHSEIMGGIAAGTVGRTGDQVDHRIDPHTGEVQVLTPGATLGYYQAPELTAELFTPDGWIHTGDMGTIDAEGRLHLVGRLKDNFKTSKGKYVAPAPIEHQLIQHLSVDACLVVGLGMSQPIGVVVLNETTVARLPGARGELEAEFTLHLERINAVLDPHEQLECIVLTTTPWTPDNGLLTPTLKVKRPSLEKRFGERFAGWSGQRRAIVWDD